MSVSRVLFALLCVCVCALAHNARATHLRVTTVESPPFVFHNGTAYTGIVPELLAYVASHANFTYELLTPVDGQYGALRSNGSWTGMIGDVVNGHADLIAAPLTITAARAAVVHFAEPFLNTGVGVISLHKSSVNALVQGMRFIFDVFTWQAWLMIGGMVVVGGVVFWLFTRYPAFRSDKRDACSNEDTCTPGRAMWFSLSAFLWLPTRWTPRGKTTYVALPGFSLAMRIASLLLISGIIAQSGRLREATLYMSIETVYAENAPFATVSGSAVESYFATAVEHDLLDMHSTMSTYETVDAGIDALRAGVVPVFVFDAPILMYESAVAPACDIVTGPQLFDTVKYAFATSPALPSALRDAIDAAVEEAIDVGVFSQLYSAYVIALSQCEGKGVAKQSLTGTYDHIAIIALPVMVGAFIMLALIVYVVGWIHRRVADARKKRVGELLADDDDEAVTSSETSML